MKYFFGFGYSYGNGKGREKFYNPKDVSPIPDWIREDIISKMEEAKLVPSGWINSVVVNDYESGGFIVQHQVCLKNFFIYTCKNIVNLTHM